MLSMLLINLVMLSDVKQNIEGFLSGFQNTDVYLKSDCLSNDWKQSFVIYLESLRSPEILNKANSLYSLHSLLKSLKSSCHITELLEIFSYLINLDERDYLLHTLLNSVRLYKEIVSIEISDNSKSYQIGKIVRIWVNEYNYLIVPGTGDLFYYLLMEFIENDNSECKAYCENIQKSLNSIAKDDYAKIKEGITAIINN